MLEWAGGKPVTIRTVDAGGDKPVPGFTVEETNPFLGLRGMRLSLARPEVFRVQLRALLRAAVHGNLKVMFPMVTVPDEYARAAGAVRGGGDELAAEGVAHACRRSASWSRCRPWRLAASRFATPPSSRSARTTSRNTSWPRRATTPSVAALQRRANPAVLRLIGQVVAVWRASKASRSASAATPAAIRP